MMEYLIGIIIGWIIGWTIAHYVVATECRRLGGFYVGKKVYKCTDILDEGKNERKN